MSYPQAASFHRYSRLFRGSTRSVSPGHWRVRFAGKEIVCPLKSESIWLDWDIALSIVGHDIEVKETYENLLASEFRPDVFVDVGTNYGTHSLPFLCHHIRVISFEPNSSCRAYFEKLCAANGYSSDVRVVALGETAGKVTIRSPERETWLGSVDQAVQERLAGQCELVAEEVEQHRLDEYLAELVGHRVLLKIDTEGNEFQVLKGADQTLRRCKPIVIFECWKGDQRRHLIELFGKHGYDIYPLPWDPTSTRDPFDPATFISSSASNFVAVFRADGSVVAGD